MLILPIFLPLLTGLVLILILFPSKATSMSRWLQYVLLLISVCAQVIVAFLLFCRGWHTPVLVASMGGWVPPIGIVLTADLFSLVMVLMTAIISFWVLLYCMGDSAKIHPLRFPLICFLVAGVQLVYLTGDFFNLFVAFELMLMESYALMTLERDAGLLPRAWVYIKVNILGGLLFFVAAGLVYALFGNLSFAQIIQQLHVLGFDARLMVLGALFLFIFGLKAGVFPLYYWLPTSYPVLPIPVAALFAALLPKVGIYALFRVFGTVFPHTLYLIYGVLIGVSLITMLVGSILSLSTLRWQQVLCFNLMAHIGVILLGFGLFTVMSVTGSIFYLVHHMVVMASLFLIMGLWEQSPPSFRWMISGLFFVQMLALAGFPPFSGFWGKYILLKEVHLSPLVLVCILGVSFFTLVSMSRLWVKWAWSPIVPNAGLSNRRALVMCGSIMGLVFVSLWMGFYPSILLDVSKRAAQSVLDPVTYSNRVLNMGGERF